MKRECPVCQKIVPTTGDYNFEGTRSVIVPDDGATTCSYCEEIIHVECMSPDNGALCKPCGEALKKEAAAA